MAEMTTPVVEKMTVKAEETAPEEDKKQHKRSHKKKHDMGPYTKTLNWSSEKVNVTETTISGEDSRVKEMRRKYRDYFDYSFSGKNITNEEAGKMIAQCSTGEECADSGEK